MAKQVEIKGMERPVIKAIENAAEEYVTIRDKRMVLTGKEIEAKAKLLDVMTKHKKELAGKDGVLMYRYDERIVEVKEVENVKVRKVVDDEGGDED